MRVLSAQRAPACAMRAASSASARAGAVPAAAPALGAQLRQVRTHARTHGVLHAAVCMCAALRCACDALGRALNAVSLRATNPRFAQRGVRLGPSNGARCTAFFKFRQDSKSAGAPRAARGGRFARQLAASAAPLSLFRSSFTAAPCLPPPLTPARRARRRQASSAARGATTLTGALCGAASRAARRGNADNAADAAFA
jgi:hypothetical protein